MTILTIVGSCLTYQVVKSLISKVSEIVPDIVVVINSFRQVVGDGDFTHFHCQVGSVIDALKLHMRKHK